MQFDAAMISVPQQGILEIRRPEGFLSFALSWSRKEDGTWSLEMGDIRSEGGEHEASLDLTQRFVVESDGKFGDIVNIDELVEEAMKEARNALNPPEDGGVVLGSYIESLRPMFTERLRQELELAWHMMLSGWAGRGVAEGTAEVSAGRDVIRIVSDQTDTSDEVRAVMAEGLARSMGLPNESVSCSKAKEVNRSSAVIEPEGARPHMTEVFMAVQATFNLHGQTFHKSELSWRRFIFLWTPDLESAVQAQFECFAEEAGKVLDDAIAAVAPQE